jgi:AcrR family transcriptional regulator
LVVPTKAELTRERILAAALELFEADGFEATTVNEIADRSGVTQMTFFRYFPSKESVLIDDPYDPLMAASVARQPRSLDPLTRVVRGIREAWHSMPFPESEAVRLRLRIAAKSPTLRAGMARNTAASEQAIVEALPDVDATTARIATAATLAALTTALLAWSLRDDGALGSAIDAALDVLERTNG